MHMLVLGQLIARRGLPLWVVCCVHLTEFGLLSFAFVVPTIPPAFGKPPSPATKHVLGLGQDAPRTWARLKADWEDQVAPPLVVSWRLPPSPAATQVVAFAQLTDHRRCANPEDRLLTDQVEPLVVVATVAVRPTA